MSANPATPAETKPSDGHAESDAPDAAAKTTTPGDSAETQPATGGPVRAGALALGLVLVVGICGLAYFNDGVIRQQRVVYNLLPPVIYGGLLAAILLLNPLLRRIHAAWVLNRSELVVLLMLAAVAGSISSYGFAQPLPTTLMMPHQEFRVRPGWAESDLLGRVLPSYMLADPSSDESRVLSGYITGLSEGAGHIPLSEVPWGAWVQALCWWLPLAGMVLLMSIGMSVVVHRQWSQHECLPYPIPAFTDALLPSISGESNPLWNFRLFWWGFGVVGILHLNNYACHWWPDVLIPVRLQFDFTALRELVPVLGDAGMRLLRPSIIFSVVGLAYFIASDVSFTMSVAPIAFCLLTGTLASYGVQMRYGNHLTPHPQAMIFAGGYTGLLLMMLYTGRHYYWRALRSGLGLPNEEPVEPHVTVAVQAVLAAGACVTLMLTFAGVDLPFALLYTLGLAMVYVVISRTVVETGAFWIGSHVFPAVILLGFFGSVSLGLRSSLILFVVSTVVLCAPGWAPMPFMVHALKLGDASALPVRRLGRLLVPTALIALAVTAVATIYWQYDQGAPPPNWWPRRVAAMPYETVIGIERTLAAQGSLEQSNALGTVGRMLHARPSAAAVSAFFIALAACIGLGIGRLRFAWWPLHPVCFVFVDQVHGQMLAFSFLLGWCIKSSVERYGGARLYRQLKPLMIGLIAGELAGMFVPSVVGTVAYLCGVQAP